MAVPNSELSVEEIKKMFETIEQKPSRNDDENKESFYSESEKEKLLKIKTDLKGKTVIRDEDEIHEDASASSSTSHLKGFPIKEHNSSDEEGIKKPLSVIKPLTIEELEELKKKNQEKLKQSAIDDEELQYFYAEDEEDDLDDTLFDLKGTVADD